MSSSVAAMRRPDCTPAQTVAVIIPFRHRGTPPTLLAPLPASHPQAAATRYGISSSARCAAAASRLATGHQGTHEHLWVKRAVLPVVGSVRLEGILMDA